MPDQNQTPTPPPKKGLLLWLRNSFLTGIVITAPIGATVWVVVSFISFVDGSILPLLPKRYNPETYLPVELPGLGLVIAVIGLTLLGALAANIFGRTLIGFGESLLRRVPFVSNIYEAVKQIIHTIVSGSEKSFQDAVMIEYPRKGLWAIGFVTAEAKGELKDFLDDDMVAVFVPTTPNPTSGFLLYEKRANLHDLNMSVEDAAKLVISAGLVYPEPPESSGKLKSSKKKK
ncbi:Uncharacterized membrane anchored protein Mext_4159 [hydrothermal vent metagenome]|uniref:Uncharacterized membrane anchored protein Mext_4159 n=1 Tax=hydrothermal vent metagenome TaxID=652676 RepID=A0A3B0RTJ2_9ZZZZ